MSESLFSQSWYRVAPLKPRLRSQAEIHRHHYRGELWYILQDHATGRFNRYSPEAYFIIQSMNGERTIDTIFEMACAELGDDMPSQDEIIGLLGQLHQGDLLQSDVVPDIADIHHRAEQHRKNKILQYVKSPLALRIPLVDPERFLVSTLKFVRPMLGVPALIIWSLLIVYALFQAGAHWEQLTNNWTDRVFSFENFMVLGLVYPIVKLIHELGHAYMVKRFGGEVHEIGLMFLIFVPIPYVDASASAALRSKYQRMLIGGAGIMVEMALAAIGLLIWIELEPGLLRALMFNVILIGGVSTILFNGNPLLKFDAYYVLADFLEMPNLGTRANQYLGYWLQKFVLRIPEATSPAVTIRESLWLFFYSITSYLYRLFMMLGIALYVASEMFIVGVLLGLWSAYNTLIAPVVKLVGQIQRSAILTRYRSRLAGAVWFGGALIISILLFLPFPMHSTTEGVLWAPEESQVHMDETCFVKVVHVQNGDLVREGDRLLGCESLELGSEVDVLRARLRELQARERSSFRVDQIQHNIVEEELARTTQELAIGIERQNKLVLKASAAGRVYLQRSGDLVGKFFRKGAYLGYIDQGMRNHVKVIVAQSDISYVEGDMKSVSALMTENLSKELRGKVLSKVPAATKELPSMVLSTTGGGSVVLDPAAGGESSRQSPNSAGIAINPYFILELELDDRYSSHVGTRVLVRFEHSAEPLGYRLARFTRRLVMQQFGY
jgi:putative peptide zinc metalloprotease protein